jgi:hypothetical protein
MTTTTTATPCRTTLHPAVAALLAEGYKLGPPPSLSASDAAADLELATDLPCACGRTGGRFVAVHRKRPAEYRCFVICECGAATEF